jgi:hypothetical protein
MNCDRNIGTNTHSPMSHRIMARSLVARWGLGLLLTAGLACIACAQATGGGEPAQSRPAAPPSALSAFQFAGEIRKGAAIAVPSEIIMRSDAYRAWKFMTSAEGFQTLSGFKIDTAAEAFNLNKLGDSAASEQWGHKGHIVVTLWNPPKEMQVTWTPDDNSYLFAKRMLVAPLGEQCRLQSWDQYTDFQNNADTTAQQLRELVEQCSAAFKKMVEKSHRDQEREASPAPH